jgi:hypothetical protein
MAKRIIAGVLGLLAVFASLLPVGYAFEIFKDFQNPDVPFWPNVLAELFMCSIALAGLWIGIHFLRFASSGRNQQSNSWIKRVLLGIGLFFPGFVFSLPITILWANRAWPGDGRKIDLALEVSVFVGVAAATIGTILLIRKRVLRHTS